MTTPYVRRGFPKETSLAELYHENTKIAPYMRDANDDTTGAALDLPAVESYAYAPAARIRLPPPATLAGPLSEVMRARRSTREFANAPLALHEIATLFGLSYGESPRPFRIVPSAGARYPLELFLLAHDVDGLQRGVYHYHPETHTLEPWKSQDIIDVTSRALVGGARAAAHVVIGAVFSRTTAKYRERGYRLILLDAGHAMQNLLLAATGLGLASTALGGFVDDELNDLVGFDGVDENVLYAAALGRPR